MSGDVVARVGATDGTVLARHRERPSREHRSRFHARCVERGVNDAGIAIGDTTLHARDEVAATGLFGMDLVLQPPGARRRRAQGGCRTTTSKEAARRSTGTGGTTTATASRTADRHPTSARTCPAPAP